MYTHPNVITQEQVWSFILLRCLVYAIQLKRASFEDKDIDTLLDQLYSIEGFPISWVK